MKKATLAVAVLLTIAPSAQQLPPEMQAIHSPACANAPPPASPEIAMMNGCHRLWSTAASVDPQTPAEQKQRWHHWRTLHLMAQVLGRGHYAVRQATKEELDALAKLTPPAASTSGLSSGGLVAGPWQGSGSKDTETFAMAASEWRIVWMATSTSRVGGVLNITVHSADTNRIVTNVSSGDIRGQAKDVSYVRAPAGRFYLSISSANAQWTVGVEAR